jgi:type VI secretion system protein VasG
MEKHHKVQILDEALEAAVKLSHRYIPARQLPDKAVSLLDTACARVAVSLHATPAEVDDSRKRIEALEPSWASSAAKRRSASTPASAGAADEALLAERPGWPALEQRWKDERALVDELLRLRAKLRDGASRSKAPAASWKPPRRSRRRPSRTVKESETRRAAGAAASAAGEAGRGAGRIAADPADRGLPGRGLGGRRLDRHPGRPHGARTRWRPCSSIAARWASA